MDPGHPLPKKLIMNTKGPHRKYINKLSQNDVIFFNTNWPPTLTLLNKLANLTCTLKINGETSLQYVNVYLPKA